MNKQIFITLTAVSVQFQLHAAADWSPKVYNAIKWTAPDQGKQTISYTTSVGITRIPMAYHGGVDTNASGEITEQNIQKFTNWTEEKIPRDYCGPIVMDYEQPWWKLLGQKTILPEQLQEIVQVYSQGVEVAKGILPNAQWGYWGLPLKRNTSDQWLNQGNTLEPLLTQCGALYPDVYDANRGRDTSAQAQKHIERVLEEARGKIPVYVFVSPRFTGEGGDHSNFIPDETFLKHVNGAMKAKWVDASGIQHRIQGVILWDAYGYTEESQWDELDTKHKYYFQLLQALVSAWEKSMAGLQIETGLPTNPICQYGLPEPINSKNAIDDAPIHMTEQSSPQQESNKRNAESDRVSSGRINSNRITE